MHEQKITCYLDESATDGSTPCSVVGGVLINSSGHKQLVLEWKTLLDDFDLWPGLHLREFSPDHQPRSKVWEKKSRREGDDL
jgi:hypothetical protein